MNYYFLLYYLNLVINFNNFFIIATITIVTNAIILKIPIILIINIVISINFVKGVVKIMHFNFPNFIINSIFFIYWLN